MEIFLDERCIPQTTSASFLCLKYIQPEVNITHAVERLYVVDVFFDEDCDSLCPFCRAISHVDNVEGYLRGKQRID